MPSYDLLAHRERTAEDAWASQGAMYGSARGMGVDRNPSPAARLNETLERIYSQHQYQWALNAQTLSSFVHNAQFTKDQVNQLAARGQAAVPINIVYPATQQAVSMLTSNKPRFQATAREDSDAKTAKVVADLMSWIWEISDANAHLKTAIFDYYVKGRGVLMAYIDPNDDYGRGEVKITSVDPLDVFPDPNSKDRLWRDASHIIVSRIFTREQIESMWPEAVRILPAASQAEPMNLVVDGMVRQDNQFIGQLQQTDPYHERYKVIERYTKVKVQYTHALDRVSGIERTLLKEQVQEYLAQPAIAVEVEGPSGPQQRILTQGPELRQMLEIYQTQSQPMPGADPRTRLYQPPPTGIDPETGEIMVPPPVVMTLMQYADLAQMGMIVMRDVLLDRIQLVVSIGGQEFYNHFLPISHYPLIPLNNLHDRNPYPMSDIGIVKPLQESLNKLHMQIVANLSSGNNQKLIVPRGAIDRKAVERELDKVGRAIIEVDYEMGEPKPWGPAPMPAGLFVHYQNLVQMIERQLGIFSMQQGDAAAAPQTHKGTLALDEFGQRRIRSKLDDIEQALNHLGKVCVQLMQHVYTEEKVIRLVQPNNTVIESVANQLTYDDFGRVTGRIADITLGSYDVIVVSGSTLPSNRWALSEYYNELYQLGLIDQVEVLKKTELVDTEGVLERHSHITQLQQMVAALQEEIKRLKGDLQTAERAEVNSRKRVEVEKFKSDLQSATTKAQAAQIIYQARLQDDLQNRRQAAKQEAK